MLAYAEGDAEAFGRLYQRFRKPLFGFLQRGLADRSLVDECFQDVWTSVIGARARYEPSARFSTWLFQIAHNRMVDVWRRQKPQRSLDELDEAGAPPPIDSGPSPEAAVNSFQQRRRLQDALLALPTEQRVALQLRLEQEFSLEQIAEITGSGRETVKSRLRYAMDKLRAQLAGRES